MTLTIWALLAGALLLGWLLSRLPTWITLVLLALSVVLVGYAVVLGGLERATAPLIAYAVGCQSRSLLSA